MRMGPTATAECPIAFPGTCCCSPRHAHPPLHSPCAVASSPLQADDTPSVRETGAKQLCLSREVVTRKALVSHTPGATRLCTGSPRALSVSLATQSPPRSQERACPVMHSLLGLACEATRSLPAQLPFAVGSACRQSCPPSVSSVNWSSCWISFQLLL